VVTAVGHSQLRILLAEDNTVNQALAAGLLRRDGHVVTIVDNGVAAVAAVATGEFDVVLMDVQMPEMSGLDATKAIRAREPVGRCARADHRDDRSRDAWGPRPLSHRGDGRLRCEADWA